MIIETKMCNFKDFSEKIELHGHVTLNLIVFFKKRSPYKCMEVTKCGQKTERTYTAHVPLRRWNRLIFILETKIRWQELFHPMTNYFTIFKSYFTQP